MKPFLKRCQLLILGLILIGFASGGLTQAAELPLSLEDYWQQIEETQALVTSLEDASAEVSRPRLLAAADRWAQVTQVRLPDGTLVAVDHSFLVAQLRADPPDLAQLTGLLANLLATGQTWPSPKHTGADLELLNTILARPEFQWQPDRPSPLAELWRRVWEYFWELITRWLPDEGIISLDDAQINNGLVLIRYALTGLGILALILVLFFILRELLAGLVTEAAVDPDAEAGDEILTADTALKRAQQLSSSGDYRTAVRYLYLSSLLLLDERGLLRYDRAQTNREYLRSVAHLPQLVTILGEVIEVFDRVWYGYHPLDEVAYAQYAARVAELRRQK